MVGYAHSVKCSSNTKKLLKELFKSNPELLKLQEQGVVLNVSWFFKYCASIVLRDNLLQQDSEFAYSCHYVDNFDELLDN